MSKLLLSTASFAALFLLSATARGVTPESPEVKQVVEKALAFLSAHTDTRLGAQCLLGLCMLKNDRQPTDPKIATALAACQSFAKSPAASVDNYSVGLSLIFLCELDGQTHRDDIERIVAHMLTRQQPGGGWSYTGMKTGDTSQTQYAALGLWMADAVGVEVPQENVERLCGWLLRTQDPSGAWGYQGLDPGGQTRVMQSEVRHSLAAAGLGSLYICADLLDINDPQDKKANSGVPAALRIIEGKARGKRGDGRSKVIDAAAVRRAMADGNKWFDQNFSVQSKQWTHYYHYGLERYQAYRDLSEGSDEAEPRWYNEVFSYLQKTQLPSGGWRGDADVDGVNTAFAVLCLSRSSRKTIEKHVALGNGVLLGGMGLPKDVASLQERNGKVVESPLAGAAEELLAIMEDPNNPELSRMAEAGAIVSLDGDVTKRAGQVTRLRSLVSAGSFESRLLAVKTLSKVRDLDNVPILLYALSDPDMRVVRQADKGLRNISRKFAGVGLPEEPTALDARAAQKSWKAWYLAARPDAELLE